MAVYNISATLIILFTLVADISVGNPVTSMKKKQLIVVSLPDDPCINEGLRSFIREYAQQSRGVDDFLVICSSESAKSLLGIKIRRLIVDKPVVPEDIWMRDFAFVSPKNQVKFSYRPKYLKEEDARSIESDFMSMMGKLNIQPMQQSDIVLEGGNVVENNNGKVIISERILVENKGKDLEVLRSELENLFAAKVALIPDPGTTTGHAGDIVAFVEDDVLLIGDYGDNEYYEAVVVAMKSAFPDVETVRLPFGKQDNTLTGEEKCKGVSRITISTGADLNMLVTRNALYVPVFKSKSVQSDHVFNITKAHTSKTVKFVDTGLLGHMGGNVRDMTWQIDTDNPVAVSLYKNSIV